MGNKCSSCLNSQSTDEAEDALLGQEQPNPATSSHVVVSTGERRHRLSRTRRLLVTRQQAPREPPPPYQQVHHPCRPTSMYYNGTISSIILLVL